VDPTIEVPIRLECYLSPRTDGVWGEIRDAMDEDAEDLAAAAAVGGSMDPDPVQPPIVVHIEPDGPASHLPELPSPLHPDDGE
jgi:hypothetical protein